MSSDSFSFTVSGVSYESFPFRVRDGLKLSLALSAIGAEALIRVLGPAAKALLAKGGKLSEALDTDLSSLEIDFSGVDLGQLRATLIDGTGEALILDLLRQTYRAGKTLDAEAAGNALDAFQGSYGDLYRVVWKVIEGNGFLPRLAG